MNTTIWTARITVFLYLTGMGLSLTGHRPRLAKAVWTIGFLMLLVHVAAAFHFIHHWSHTTAWVRTAEQTEHRLGWYWGGGIWFNYLFLVIWGIDVLLLWSKIRPSNVLTIMQAYLAFIVVNTTAVFGPIGWIPVIIVAGFILGLLIARRSESPTWNDR